METIKYTDVLDETMRINRLPNGLTCYIIPKKGYVEKQAVLSVRYGSVDSVFETDSGLCETPAGTAHFLEHKLFDDESMPVFDEFARLGARLNAYTNYLNTAYYFNCVDNFAECLTFLLRFLQGPRFTDESVEKEKPIIIQEISMYEDSPFWRLALDRQAALYECHPVRESIAGSAESVSAMDRETLLKCYETFYFPGNAALICVGDLDHALIYDLAERNVRPRGLRAPGRIYAKEPAAVFKRRTETRMPLARPMFSVAFKEYVGVGRGDIRKATATNVLMDILAGESSPFFNRLYEQGLLDGPFGMEYLYGPFFGAAVFTATGADPDEAAKLLMHEITDAKRRGIDEERFEQIKNKHIGRFVRGFNNIDNIAAGQADLFAKGMDLFDMMNGYKDCSYSYMMERMNQLFNADNFTLSVVWPN